MYPPRTQGNHAWTELNDKSDMPLQLVDAAEGECVGFGAKPSEQQQEYGVVWEIRSPQMKRFPDTMDLELTRTGLNVLRPWSPPA